MYHIARFLSIHSPSIQVCLQSVTSADVLAQKLERLHTAPQGWVKCRDLISLQAVCVTNNVPLP